jgi:hypothetical protein
MLQSRPFHVLPPMPSRVSAPRSPLLRLPCAPSRTSPCHTRRFRAYASFRLCTFQRIGSFHCYPRYGSGGIASFYCTQRQPICDSNCLDHWVHRWRVLFRVLRCRAGAADNEKAKGTKGFSLGEKAVRQELPLLVRIHAGCLVVLFAGVTGALWLRPHTWFLSHLDTDYFDFILLLTGVAIAFVQIHFFRRLLGRALEDEQRNGRS